MYGETRELTMEDKVERKSLMNLNKIVTCKFTIIYKIFETNKFSCEIAHYGKSSISVLQEIFISGGGLSARQQFYEVLRFS